MKLEREYQGWVHISERLRDNGQNLHANSSARRA